MFIEADGSGMERTGQAVVERKGLDWSGEDRQ